MAVGRGRKAGKVDKVNKRAETHGTAAFAAFTAGEQEWTKCSLCSLPFTMGELLQPTPALTYSAFVQFVQNLRGSIVCNILDIPHTSP